MNHKHEIWKDIEGYEGAYQISNLGNVRSLDRMITTSDGRTYKQPGKGLTPVENKWGYLYVNLLHKGKLKSKTIHRLVAEAFLANDNNNPQVNHIDENKKNNNVRNLQWVTVKENANHGNRNYKISESRKQKVTAFESETGKRIDFDTLADAKRYFNLTGNNVVYNRLFSRGKLKGWKLVKCEEDIV